MSETQKYQHLTRGYCLGNGIDIGSGGTPVVPWAIQVDLPDEKFLAYNSGAVPESSIHWRGSCRQLPFHPSVFDFVYSSHLLEDFHDWREVVRYWSTFVKPGGNLVILVPDRERFAEAVRAGHPPNCAHSHEFLPGELSNEFSGGQWWIHCDKHTDCHPGDYNILFAALRVS